MASPSPPFPSDLQFGSLLVYPSPATSQPEKNAKAFILALKRDANFAGGSAIKIAVDRLAKIAPDSCLADLLDGTAVLVPTPGSGLPLKNAVWCARTLCDAMVAAGLGDVAATLIERAKPIKKSAYCKPGERPTPREHYDSMKVKALIEAPDKIVLVDDVITKGATFAGAAVRLMEAFPEAEVRAFAMARTQGTMKQIIEPCRGYISCWTDGGAAKRFDGAASQTDSLF